VSSEPFDPFDELRAGRLRALRAVSGKKESRRQEIGVKGFNDFTNFLIF
jgi:hypothetical protein